MGGQKLDLKKKFVSNLSYAFTAQLVALFISMILNLVLPKYLGVENYSYWQLFIFYSQYIPFLHLGLNDGVYLRYGGIVFEEMEHRKIKSQFFLGFCYQFLLSIILCLGSWFLVSETTRVSIIILACIYFVFFTIQNYIGYIFQAANEISWYSRAIMLNRLVFLVFMIVCVLTQRFMYWYYICGYIIAQIASMLYTIFKGRVIFLARLCSIRNTFEELKKSVGAGSKLMLANITSMLILGIGRQIIDIKWGIMVFGKISFSITLTNLVLIFIQQVGMVMFPMLRQLKTDKQKQIYELCRQGMFFILPLVFIGYFPLKSILFVWLPDYVESLHYLALMLPICFFDAKMQMLCNTYLKVHRKENVLLRVNLVAMLSSLVISVLGGFVLQNLNLVVIGMVLSIALRSVISERYLAKIMGIDVNVTLVQEMSFVGIFMISAWFLSEIYGFIVITVLYLLLIVFNRKMLKEWLRSIGLA